MLWIWVFVAFSVRTVVSDAGSKCGSPTVYPGKQLDGRYAGRHVFNNGDRVVYRCALGYTTSIGTRYSTCQNGEWSLLQMQCQRKKCGSAGEILNGQFRQTGNAFEDIAYAECKEGYVLQGEPFRECLVNGWSGTVPTCVVADFAPPASDRTVICPRPKNNKNATFNTPKDTYEPGETISYHCNAGFHLIGNNNVLQCDRNGKWNPSNVNCKNTKCETFAIANGLFKFSEITINTKVTISCKDGYKLSGQSVVTCGADGSWTPALPTCEEGTCQPPPYFPNAYTEQDKRRRYTPNTAVRYKCNHGYRMVRGPSTIYCRNGRWTDLRMKCEKNQCGSAGEIENGRYRYTGALFGDTATAVCNKGYRLVGKGVRNCRAHGWDGREAVCEAVQCPEPPQVQGADLIFGTSGIIKFDYVASYRCHFGTLIGASDIVCTEDGTWSPEAPRCEVICPSPNIPFGVIVSGMRNRYQPGSEVKFECDPRRRLSGPDLITCGADGYWKPRIPHCVQSRYLLNFH